MHVARRTSLIQPRQRKRLGLAACAPMLLLAACPTADNQAPARRSLDSTPVRSQLATPLRRGHAEAFFTLNTGADQMGQRPKEAGLVVVVRVGTDEYRQTIASCRDPGLGTALGGGTERELEVAACDGEYHLISEPGTVTVLRVDRQPPGDVVARFDLPNRSTRAVRPNTP
jgi:hypothetical protein